MMQTSFVGDWRIVVLQHDAAWQQRVVVTGSLAGQQILSGVVGQHLDVRGNGTSPWHLRIEHNDGSGWSANDLRPDPAVVSGSSITQVIWSDDSPVTGDQDYNDLVVRVEKLGMVDHRIPPFAVWPATMQMMPDGIFEASLGRYFMAVTVRNIWTQAWPAQAAVGLTARCRNWLQAAGIVVDDFWSANDQVAVGQTVAGGRVQVGALAPWESRVIYFKVDVSNAQARKESVEVEVLEPAAEDLDHLNRKARAPMRISRTVYDATNQVFVGTCDRGRMTVAVKKLTVDHHSLKRAAGIALQLFQTGGTGGEGAAGETGTGCSRAQIENLRRRLNEFLAGKNSDICGILRDLQCCCAGTGGGGKPPGDWTGQGGTGLSMFAFPTLVDYRIDYAVPFAGQFGPIPFDDPWWKLVLAIIAIILSIAAAASAALDLANHSENVVIGKVERTILNAFKNSADVPTTINSATAGNIDVAVVKLNGNRSLTTAMFSYRDASSDEENTTPIVALGGTIDTAGAALTNAQLDEILQNLADNPDDPAARAAVQVFKSGARSGTTLALIGSLIPTLPRGPEEDGSTVFFVNQVVFVQDPTAPTKIARGGDSGSLWLQRNLPRAIVALHHAGSDDDTTGFGCRIEDVMNGINIRFA